MKLRRNHFATTWKNKNSHAGNPNFLRGYCIISVSLSWHTFVETLL